MDVKEFAAISIEALGGTLRVAELFGFSEQRVSNWKGRGLPPESFDALRRRLPKKGIDPNPVMFGQYVVAKSKRGLRRAPKGNGK